MNIYIYKTYVRTNLFMDLLILKYILILSLDLQQPSLHIYIYIYISSSSSYRAGSTDIPDPLSPPLPR